MLLIWVSFVDGSFAWAVLADRRAWSAAAGRCSPWPSGSSRGPPSRSCRCGIVRQRTTALAIVASLAVGMAMFGGAVFLGQYFQIGRGYCPTEAGLLTIPMMAGVLCSSIVAGPLITRTGKIKPYIVAGAVVLVAGFGLLSHHRPRDVAGRWSARPCSSSASASA